MGSEMCIRDRYSDYPRPFIHGAGAWRHYGAAFFVRVGLRRNVASYVVWLGGPFEPDAGGYVPSIDVSTQAAVTCE